MRGFVLFIATGAGSGYAPVAPGTAGALVGLALYVLGFGALGAPLYVLTLLSGIALAVWASAGAIEIFGQKDPGQVTIDEVVGMLTTLAFLPATGTLSAGPFTIESGLLAGFVFFRMFDILKPFPIRWIERNLPGGYGIVLDDVAAGIYANVALRIVAMFLPPS
ncbi:MAG: phosphatidylglycerophosphatase A [Deltaproteobacteria bacterium]|nr:phosphatidylglycerophosphatase A [Deltaproteobacteria bacterium]